MAYASHCRLNPISDKRENGDCANLFHFNSSSEIITQEDSTLKKFHFSLLKLY